MSIVTIADLTIKDVYYHCISVHGGDGTENILIHNVILKDSGEQLLKINVDNSVGVENMVVQYSSFELTDGWDAHPLLGSFSVEHL